MAFSFEKLLDLPESARRAASLIVAIGRNRLELFSLECREELHFSLKVLTVLLAAFFLAMFGVLLVTVLLLFALPPELRLTGMACCALVYFLGSFGCIMWVKALFSRHPMPFSQTLEEMRKDGKQLREP